MLTIRLQRTGTKNKPQFRIVLAEAHKAAGKKFLEVLGHYYPRTKEFGIKNEERLKYWIAQNVQVSPTVHNLLVGKNFITEKKVKAWRPKKGEATAEAPAAPAAEAAAAPTEPAPAA
ncbi:MAG TPA: 30S ribosomal protein S16 [Verrucomicrobiae bacterium]|nr:30S ribosomal protein S16 [Verrucomicrobiae bacterium]